MKYNWHALAFHFVRWLIIHGTRESKISGGGGGFVRFSYFMYVTCRFALVKTFRPILFCETKRNEAKRNPVR